MKNVRCIKMKELEELLELYKHLHRKDVPLPVNAKLNEEHLLRISENEI
ncbi:MAG: hypothetical protein ACTSWY_11300 [Promethearchaeota archaeon]